MGEAEPGGGVVRDARRTHVPRRGRPSGHAVATHRDAGGFTHARTRARKRHFRCGDTRGEEELQKYRGEVVKSVTRQCRFRRGVQGRIQDPGLPGLYDPVPSFCPWHDPALQTFHPGSALHQMPCAIQFRVAAKLISFVQDDIVRW